MRVWDYTFRKTVLLEFSQVLRVKNDEIFEEQHSLTPRDVGCDENKRTKAVKGSDSRSELYPDPKTG